MMTKLSLVILFWAFVFSSIYFAYYKIWDTSVVLLILALSVEVINIINQKYKILEKENDE